MITGFQILQASTIKFEPYDKWSKGNVLLTEANQLMGAFRALKEFQHFNQSYSGWQAHHIVETVDLERLGVAAKFTPRDEQLCVLITERAHIGRINSILRSENPLNLSATRTELWTAYRSAYALMGDYCGGGEARIRHELMAIVRTIFSKAFAP
jgi:hypothetical protein